MYSSPDLIQNLNYEAWVLSAPGASSLSDRRRHCDSAGFCRSYRGETETWSSASLEQAPIEEGLEFSCRVQSTHTAPYDQLFY